MEQYSASSPEKSERTVTEVSDSFLARARNEVSTAIESLGINPRALGVATATVGGVVLGSLTGAAVASILIPVLPIAIPSAAVAAGIGSAGFHGGLYVWNKLSEPKERIHYGFGENT